VPRAGRRLIARLLALVVVVGAGAAGAWLYVVGFWAELPHAGRGEEVIVEVPRGTGPRRLARALAERGVVGDPWRFELLVRARRAAGRIRAGRYLLRDDLTPAQVLGRVARVGAGGALRVTLPEGKTLQQVADILEAQGIVPRSALLAAARDPVLLARLDIPGDSAEGWLFPDTYDLVPGTDAAEVLRRLRANFARRVEPLFAVEARRLDELGRAGVDRRGVIVLASLVEAEARRAEERPRVAAVFLNRLTRPGFSPRYLNTDPAVAYGCRVEPTSGCAGFDGDARRITRPMLRDPDNRYNTYRHPGLPPGPIDNPGLAALRAVLEPALTDDLYFVARGDGSHAFAATLPEHEANVARYR